MVDSDRLAKIKLLVVDVDGTLTEGSMVFLEDGQIKIFHVHDGLGIRLAMGFGLDVALVTGNVSQAVTDRAVTLGIKKVYQGVRYKREVLERLARENGLCPEEIAYVGDDLNDLPAFEKAGFCIAVADAAEEVKSRADYVTQRQGGRGAVREAIETILKARGQWEAAVASFLAELKREEEGKPAPEALA